MTETSPEPAQERWTYAGVRVSSDGKREHAWLDASGEERFFRRTGASMAVSSHYTVQVTRRDDGTITIHGTPSTPARPLMRPPAGDCGPSTSPRRPGWS